MKLLKIKSLLYDFHFLYKVCGSCILVDDEKMELVSMMNEEVMIDGKMNYINNAIKIYCRSLFDALNEGDIALIKFYKNEL